MLSLSSHLKYYLYSDPVDMRKSFDSLSGLVSNHLHRNPKQTASVFIFINKHRDKVKLLHYEQGGLVLYYKRLDKGSFSYVAPDKINNNQACLNWAELVVLLQGLSLSRIVKTKANNPQKQWVSNQL